MVLVKGVKYSATQRESRFFSKEASVQTRFDINPIETTFLMASLLLKRHADAA